MRNLRVLAQAALQHVADDPVLFALQVSRRLPFRARMLVGAALERTRSVTPEIAALGFVMSDRPDDAEEILESLWADSRSGRSRLAGEIAVQLDRSDALGPAAHPSTRARAAWGRGDLREALSVLQESGRAGSRQALRLRSERALLEPGCRLPVPGTGPSAPPEGRSAPSGADLRVLHLLTNSLPHTQSGYSLRSHRILMALRDEGITSVALTRTGYPVMVGIPGARDEDVVDDIRYVRTLPHRLPRTQEERLQSEVERALRLVDEFDPHVLHVTTNYQNVLVAQAVADATGLPWVFEVRGLMEQTWVASRRTDEARAAAARSEKHDLVAAKEAEQAREADAVVTLSSTMADELVGRGVEPGKISLVPNAVDEALFEDHLTAARARERTGVLEVPGFTTESFLVGAVSALVDYEGYDTLLRAVALLLEARDVSEGLREEIRVVIAGDGVSRPGLAVLAEELGISDRVLLPGRVPRAEARDWVQALDLVVVPRQDVAVTRAVTPQKPIEALALNRPVIASDLPALREVLSGPAGTTYADFFTAGDPRALADAIVRRATAEPVDDARAREASTMARERTWARQVRRYRELYENLVDDGGGGDAGF